MDTIIEILSGLHPDIDFTAETGLIDRRIIDSFDMVSLVSELTDKFGVEIYAEHMIPGNFNSAEQIYQLVCRLKDGES